MTLMPGAVDVLSVSANTLSSRC